VSSKNLTVASCVQDLKELVHLLRSDSAAVQEGTALAVRSLTYYNPAYAVSFADLGAIPPLVHLLRSESAAVQEHSAWAVCMLSLKCLANRVSFAKLGAIQPLVHLLCSDSAAVRGGAAEAMSYITLDNPAPKVLIQVSFAQLGLEFE